MPKVARESIIDGPSSAEKSPTIIGAELTPARVAHALRRADNGYMRSLCDLCSELRESTPQIQTELAKREGAVSNSNIMFQPVKADGRRAEKRAQEIADYVSYRLDDVDNLSDVIGHLSNAVYYGRSAVETVFKRDTHGVGIERFELIQPQRLSYAGADWKIRIYDEAGNYKNPTFSVFPGINIRDDYPGKFIIHEPPTMGAVVKTRQGLGRLLVWIAMFWKWSARSWMEFAEIYAKGWRVGFYEKGADKEDISILKSTIMQLSGYTPAVLPETTRLQILNPPTSGGMHSDLLGTWNGEISKVVNGGTLQTETKGSAGSRAMAEVHERAEFRLHERDAKSMAQTIRRDLVIPLVRYQFGPDAVDFAPVTTMTIDRERDVDAEATRVFEFIDRGGLVDADQFREMFTSLRAPAPGAQLLNPKVKPTALTPAPQLPEDTEE
jgi:phage gp29-like protein